MASVTVACGELTEQQLKLAYEMQEAVLRSGNLDKIGELIKAGVDPNAPIGCGTFAPLDGAISTANPGITKFLLEHGARPHRGLLAMAAFSANHQNAVETVQVLAKAGQDINDRSEMGTALIAATFRENRELVNWLLAQKEVKKDELDVDGFTALMWAVKKGSTELVDTLLKAGANPSIANSRGETASTIAVQEIELRKAMVTKFQDPSQ